MTALKELVDAQMTNAYNEQTNLYENTVGIYLTSGDYDQIGQAHRAYIEKLNHFDIGAFRKVVKLLTDDIKESDPDKFANFADQFTAISDYVNARNNFNDKRKEILEADGSPSDKQAMFDSLDMRRTKAHNRLIGLINNLNHLASANGMVEPYPNDGKDFDKSNPMDRETVASILERQEPLLENVNNFIHEQAEEAHIETEAEKLKTMNPSQAIQYAMNMSFRQAANALDNPLAQ